LPPRACRLRLERIARRERREVDIIVVGGVKAVASVKRDD
jgi:hypothetical protein